MKTNTNFKLAMLLSLPNRQQHQQGFTLIEVIVAMVVLSIFILTALSAVIIGLNLKLKAKLNNEATLIIEQDIERVRYASTQFGIVTVSGTPSTTSTTNPLALTIPVSLVNNQNYLSTATAGSTLRIGSQTGAYTLTSIPNENNTSIGVTADLNRITVRATTLALGLTSGSSPSSITVADTSRINIGDRIVIGPDSSVTGSTNVFSVVVTNKTASTVAFNHVTLNASYTANNTPVTVLPRSGDVIANTQICTDGSIASSFIGSLSNVSNINFNGRTYQITRTATVPSATTVKLDYAVRDTTVSGSSLASLTAEVIPSVTFQCP